ncbi:2Fe-2S iron-sulfur cluster-binding protein [Sphingobacterium suaedae]
MENLIEINIENRDGSISVVNLPTDINLNLMELLKASGYDILATCGGMALCATCHIEILQGKDQLPEPSEQELDMLDTLPDANDNSRLACQLRLSNWNEKLAIKIKGILS